VKPVKDRRAPKRPTTRKDLAQALLDLADQIEHLDTLDTRLVADILRSVAFPLEHFEHDDCTRDRAARARYSYAERTTGAECIPGRSSRLTATSNTAEKRSPWRSTRCSSRRNAHCDEPKVRGTANVGVRASPGASSRRGAVQAEWRHM